MPDHEQPDIQEQDAEFIDAFQQAIIDNQTVIARYDEQYLSPAPDDVPDWTTLGAVVTYRELDNGVLIACENGYAQVIVIAPMTIQVRVQSESDDFGDYFSYYVAQTTHEPPAFRISESVPYATTDDDTIYIETDTHTFRVNKDDFRLAVDTRYGRTIYNETDSVSWANNDAVRLRAALRPDEASYGTGERAFSLNLRGRQLAMWNTDPGGYSRGDDPVNYCVSFYLGVHADGVYGLLWDNPAKGVFDIGATAHDELLIQSETGAISYYLFAGESVNDVLTAYSAITGRMPMPPLWALGYHQSRYSYFDTEDILETARTLRAENMPCDAIYLDIHYMDDYRIFTWDHEKYDMQGLIDDLHALNMKLVVILDPGIKVDDSYEGYNSGIEQGIFVTYPDDQPAAGVVWPGLCHFPDFTDPKGRKWWSDQLHDLLACGVDGIWNDMNEPLMFSPESPIALPHYTRHSKEGRGGTHLELHNVYGTQMARASREALAQHRPDKRQFVISRAGSAGAQRYASSWTGDNYSTWDDLRLSLSMSLQMGLSGIAFTGADLGGFNQDVSGELLTRWMQANVLLPFYRNHSAVNAIRQEPYRFDEPYRTALRETLNLRYQLLPYLYSAFAEHAYYGYPIVRPIFMAEPTNADLRDIDDCYLVGENLLVAPILSASALRRTVYLPEGSWYDFHTNDRYEGGQLINVEAPLDTVPLFVKSGTVLPMYPTLQHTADPADQLTLRVYTDTATNRLYEDAGEGLAYQQGDYRWLQYTCVEETSWLEIQREVEGDFTPAYDLINLQVVGSRMPLNTLEVDGERYDDNHFTDGILYAQIPAEFAVLRVAT